GKIVADRREEAGLRLVGLFRLLAGEIQFRSAFADALLQGLGDDLQLAFVAAEFRDISEGRDEAAARHRVAADLYHALPVAARKAPLGNVRRAGTHVLDALAHLVVDALTARAKSTGEIPAHQIGHRHADPEQLWR